MSVSIDDLVASLNSNHIGQEASDLANLQASPHTVFLYQLGLTSYILGATRTGPAALSALNAITTDDARAQSEEVGQHQEVTGKTYSESREAPGTVDDGYQGTGTGGDQLRRWIKHRRD